MKYVVALGAIAAAGAGVVAFWPEPPPPPDEPWAVNLGATPSILKKQGDILLAAIGAELRAFEARSGRALWTAAGDDAIVRVEPAGDFVFVVEAEGTVSAVRPADGAVLWRLRSDHPLAPGGFSFDRRCVYIGTTDGVVQCVNPDTGRTEWSQRYDAPAAVGACAFMAGVAVGTQNGEILLYVRPGRTAWRRRVDGEVVEVASLGNRIVACLVEGAVALDAETGETMWKLADGRFRLRGILNGAVLLDSGSDAVLVGEGGAIRLVRSERADVIEDRGWEWVAEQGAIRRQRVRQARRGCTSRPRPRCSPRRPPRHRRRRR